MVSLSGCGCQKSSEELSQELRRACDAARELPAFQFGGTEGSNSVTSGKKSGVLAVAFAIVGAAYLLTITSARRNTK